MGSLAVKDFGVRSLLEAEHGKLETAIKLAIKKIVDDLNDRPALSSARKLTMELSFVPVLDSNTVGGAVTCDGATLKFKLKTGLPHQESKPISLGMGMKGLQINVDAPENVDQHTMFTEEDEG